MSLISKAFEPFIIRAIRFLAAGLMVLRLRRDQERELAPPM
jgi:hypothetical protein